MKANCKYNNWYEDQTINIEVDYEMLAEIEEVLKQRLAEAVNDEAYKKAQQILNDLMGVIEKEKEYGPEDESNTGD